MSADRNVIRIWTPICRLYLIRGNKGYLLVDGGTRWHYWPLRLALWLKGIKPQEIKWALATHGHLDHVGTFHALKARCGCRIWAHRGDRCLLEHDNDYIPPPANWVGRLLATTGRCVPWLIRCKGVRVDRVIDGETPLHELGIRGTIVPTPAHSPGSVSLVLDSNEACVGDLMANHWLAGHGLPCFAEEARRIPDQWQALLDRRIELFYPGHGRPATVKKVGEWLARLDRLKGGGRG